jgi:hypothetical protein
MNATSNCVRTVIKRQSVDHNPSTTECQGMAGHAWLYHGIWPLQNLYKDRERCIVVKGMDKVSLAISYFLHWGGSRH